jgi:hypothetical protein
MVYQTGDVNRKIDNYPRVSLTVAKTNITKDGRTFIKAVEW